MFNNVSIKLLPLLMVLLILSCDTPQNSKSKLDKNTINARVFLSAGENYPLFNTLDIPTFFNLAKIESDQKLDLNTIVLGKKKSKGIKLSVHPVALFSFQQDTTIHKYIVSIDSNNEKIDYDYNSFLLNNYNMQSTIENWFKSQCIRDNCHSFHWNNKLKALLEINNQ